MSYKFKVPTSVVLDLFTNKTYSGNNAFAWRPLTQYVRVIMQYKIGYIIINIANQLFIVYWDITPKPRVYISLSIETTKILDFIYTLEKK